jgi:hypothetical protein
MNSYLEHIGDVLKSWDIQQEAAKEKKQKLSSEMIISVNYYNILRIYCTNEVFSQKNVDKVGGRY